MSAPLISDAPPVVPAAREASAGSWRGLLLYFAVGVAFGVVITKGELISWFRIQEMFRFQGFHMFGIFLTALPVAILTTQLLKRSHARTLGGEPIQLPPKTMGRGIRYIVGGTLFGLGWALTGACPGPLLALWGSGVGVIGVAIVSAMLGTWAYGWLRPRLPH
ncbi:DUF6691 family protein [Hymenobacter edaphi]|uniref:YeeE/YedE family protein n=1 Tax=Hymenobacter edaphi TaxID=2211146 RepID=A0A328B7P9_9BACT|nr:DUF6691 family protein [Hymenobacter edaphi]RAK62937.1 YeeE/YedE family protein [Hymenobacter edaphi]